MNREILAPITISTLIALYMMVWINSLSFPGASEFLAILFGIPMLALLFLRIHVVKERLDEIGSEEEDDLGKY